MAIVKIKKFNLINFKNELNSLLKTLQDFTEVDFIVSDFEYENTKSIDKDEIEDNIFKIESILKKISRYTKSKSSLKTLKEGKREFTYQELENYVKGLDILNLVENINSILGEREYYLKKNENLQNEINEYRRWKDLDITKEDLFKLKTVDILIGTMSIKNFENFNKEILENTVLKKIYEDKKEVNFVIFSSKSENIEEKLRLYNFNKINLDISKKPKEMIENNLHYIEKNKLRVEEYENTLRELSNNVEDLEISYEYYRNLLLKENTKEKFKQTDKLNILTGYIPEEREKDFIEKIEMVCGKNYYLEYENIDENSLELPIKLKNNEVFAPFEMLTATYSLPRYTEIDPTIVVAPFFWMFFGMMLADFGYGAIISLVSLFSIIFFKLDKSIRSIMKFLFMLGISTMIWGLLYGSLLGYTFENPLHFFSPTLDYQPVMYLSIGIGAIHILLALLVKAYILIRNEKYLDALFDVVFWIVALISLGIFMLYGSLIAKYLMIIFMLLIVLTGGRSASSVGGKIGMGVYALYGISGYIGDLISYVRLMALALSGGYIAYAVNMIASMIGSKGIMIIFMLIVMVIGHSFNLLLSILGAYVHTSRLIYVEFFSKFYEGGGRAFKDFKIKEKYINIKEIK